jgi:hypothetical protein
MQVRKKGHVEKERADEEEGIRERTMGWVMIRWTLVDAMAAAAAAGARPPTGRI